MAVLATFFLLAPFGIVFCLNQSKHLTVKEIVITGNEEIDASEIIMRSGIWTGSTSMLFSSDTVKERIGENLWIESVNVKKMLHGKVLIEISEGEPFCVVAPENESPYYVNSEGRNLGPVKADRGMDFPLISVREKISTGLLFQAMEILRLSKSSPLLGWQEISEIVAGEKTGLKLITVDSRVVNFGKDNIRSKWRKVERIISHSRAESLVEEYIDISSGAGVISYDYKTRKK